MARIKIAMPKEFLFCAEIPVRVTDLNYGEHVGNDTILSIIHEARMQFLNKYGFDEGKIVHEGIGLIMSDVAISYNAEIFYGTTLEVLISPAEYSRKGFDLLYLIRDKQTKKTYAKAKSGMVCFCYEKRKTLMLPEELPTIWAVTENTKTYK